ncbi:uncharacterized protein [Ptychodera flava]|uniref:uncharacterized protein n=1 Tax=Ptychodera flava TaxID=63121 RepID=UPI003969DED7
MAATSVPDAIRHNQPVMHSSVLHSIPREKLGVLEAYILAVPLGWSGLHHFYLKRPGFGILYLCTFGLLGIGWIFDWFRIPCLVKAANLKIQHEHNPSFFPVIWKKRVDDAYILALPFGILGFHHYYLDRYAWGLAYTFTLGFLGIGWVIDLFRMPCLVSMVNDDIQRRYQDVEYKKPLKSTCDAYVLGIPLGFLGLHHFYLDRIGFGLLYIFTLGLLGVGWIIDILRMPCLVRDVNRRIQKPDPSKSLCDAYVLWFPFGIIGFHHYYLNRPCWGTLYLFTLGIFGIGWLIDFCRMPFLVKRANKKMAETTYYVSTDGSSQATGYSGQNYQYPPHLSYPEQPQYPRQHFDPPQHTGQFPQQQPSYPQAGQYPPQQPVYQQQHGNYGSMASGYTAQPQAGAYYPGVPQQPQMAPPQPGYGEVPPPQPGYGEVPPPYSEHPTDGHTSSEGAGTTQVTNEKQMLPPPDMDASSRPEMQPSAPPATPP